MTQPLDHVTDSLLSELDPSDHILDRIERAIEPVAWRTFWYRPMLTVLGVIVGASMPLGLYQLWHGLLIQGLTLVALAVAVGYILVRETQWVLSDKQAALLLSQSNRSPSLQKLALEHRKTGAIGYFEALAGIARARNESPMPISNKVVLMPMASAAPMQAC